MTTTEYTVGWKPVGNGNMKCDSCSKVVPAIFSEALKHHDRERGLTQSGVRISECESNRISADGP